MASIKEVDRFFSDRNNFNISRYGGTLSNLKIIINQRYYKIIRIAQKN